MIYVEIAAVFFTFLSVWLAVKNNKLTWILGAIGIVLYAILFYNDKELSWNFFLQFFFLGYSVVGWLNWKEKKNTKITSKPLALVFIVVVFLASLLFDSCNLDFFIFAFSVIATVLLTKKVIETWFFWIIVNLMSIVLYYQQGLYIASIQYVVFLLMAVLGYFNWRKLMKTSYYFSY